MDCDHEWESLGLQERVCGVCDKREYLEGMGPNYPTEPSFGSGPYWYAEYVRERKKHMAAIRAVSAARVVNTTPYAWTQPDNDRKRMLAYEKILRDLQSALNETEGSDGE